MADTSINTGFPCVARSNARILILGSMPGQRSLQAQQYYAHPRNAFWPIMAKMFDFDPALAYDKRLQILTQHHVALWDVARQCIRPGSLDADIRQVEANDFQVFFAHFSHIQAVFFNGQKARDLFNRLILPSLSSPASTLEYHLLPSTSPAHATMSFADKCAAWRSVQLTLENEPGKPYLPGSNL